MKVPVSKLNHVQHAVQRTVCGVLGRTGRVVVKHAVLELKADIDR